MGNVTYNFRAPPSPMYLLMLLSHSVILDSLGPHGLHYAKLSCPSLSPRVCWLISTELMMPSKSHSLLPASSPALNLSQHQSSPNPNITCVHHCVAHSFFLSGYEALEDINQGYGPGMTSCFTVFVEGWRWTGQEEEEQNKTYIKNPKQSIYGVCVSSTELYLMLFHKSSQ